MELSICQLLIIWYPNSCVEGSREYNNQIMQPIPPSQKGNRSKKQQSKQHGVTSNRNLIMQIFNRSPLFMAKICAVSSKLWQKLPQSMNELSWHKQITLYIRKQARKNI